MIHWHKKAQKHLEKIEIKYRDRIKEAVRTFYDQGRGDVSKLKGFKDIYRLRVGNFRILFKHEHKNIYVLDVASRGDVYK
jgi:mRNA interferase RelE/StbE